MWNKITLRFKNQRLEFGIDLFNDNFNKFKIIYRFISAVTCHDFISAYYMLKCLSNIKDHG